MMTGLGKMARTGLQVKFVTFIKTPFLGGHKDSLHNDNKNVLASVSH